MSGHLDPERRSPEQLLEAWPTLTQVAAAANGPDVDVAIVQAADRDALIEHGGVECHFVAERPWRLVRRLVGQPTAAEGGRLVTRIVQLEPSIVHVHGLSFARQIGRLSRRLARVPILVQDHADRVPRWWRRPLHRPGLSGIAAVAFTAREQADPFLKSGMLPRRVRVFEIMESSSRFEPGDQTEARCKTGLCGDPCLLWLGHLDRNKDPLTVLEAMSQAVPALSDPQLWCFFRAAPLEAAVRRRVADDRRLAGRVHLIGSRPHDQIEDLLRAADFLVQASQREGSGYAVIEALACGTIPIVTDIAPLRRITGGGRVGGLAGVADAEDFARVLLQWAGRDRRQLRRAARMHFEHHLSFEALGRDLRAAYRALARSS